MTDIKSNLCRSFIKIPHADSALEVTSRVDHENRSFNILAIGEGCHLRLQCTAYSPAYHLLAKIAADLIESAQERLSESLSDEIVRL